MKTVSIGSDGRSGVFLIVDGERLRLPPRDALALLSALATSVGLFPNLPDNETFRREHNIYDGTKEAHFKRS